MHAKHFGQHLRRVGTREQDEAPNICILSASSSWERAKFLAFRLPGMIKNCGHSAHRDILKRFFRPRREEDLRKPFSFLLVLDGDGFERVFRVSVFSSCCFFDRESVGLCWRLPG